MTEWLGMYVSKIQCKNLTMAAEVGFRKRHFGAFSSLVVILVMKMSWAWSIVTLKLVGTH